MPIFEYRCSRCETEFEVLVRSNEAATCPGCQSEKVEKLFSAPAAHVSQGSLTIAGGCSSDLPPCRPNCCRLPQ